MNSYIYEQNQARVTEEVNSMTIKILIVDDADDLREIIAELLRSYDYSVEVAKDGIEALGCAVVFNPDIILSDMKMPNMSGPDLKKLLSVNVLTASIPVIFMSGFSSEFPGTDVHILQKPFTIPQLIKALARVL